MLDYAALLDTHSELEVFMADDTAEFPSSFPVSVLMERQLARSGPWSAYQWSCVGVVVGSGHGGG